MTIWNYKLLNEFKQARLGNKIIGFDDLKKERMFHINDQEYHCWIATKDKKDYLITNDMLEKLPIKINQTSLVKDNNAVFHFVTDFSHVGFAPEKKHSFKRLVDGFFDVIHSNSYHHTIFKIIAFSAYFSRLNVRVATNPEFGKDSTFLSMNYLTNSIAVFDKPKTMAKLEYGVVNQVLMVNELVPKKEEERIAISEFLLSIGSLTPTYNKTTRASAAHGTKDSYDISNLSLVICYNNLDDVSEKDKEAYFDVVFGRNILERYLPFKFQGTIDVNQFIQTTNYTLEIDSQLRDFARSIEYYKQNWKKYKKSFHVSFKDLKLSGREKHTLSVIIDFIGLYCDTQDEFEKMVNTLIDCHYAYKRMVKSNNLLTEFTPESKPSFKSKEESLVIEVEKVNDEVKNNIVNGLGINRLTPLEFLMANNNGECDMQEFVDLYGEDSVISLIEKGDAFNPRPHILKVLQ